MCSSDLPDNKQSGMQLIAGRPRAEPKSMPPMISYLNGSPLTIRYPNCVVTMSKQRNMERVKTASAARVFKTGQSRFYFSALTIFIFC